MVEDLWSGRAGIVEGIAPVDGFAASAVQPFNKIKAAV
jgi:hypothetical protein